MDLRSALQRLPRAAEGLAGGLRAPARSLLPGQVPGPRPPRDHRATLPRDGAPRHPRARHRPLRRRLRRVLVPRRGDDALDAHARGGAPVRGQGPPDGHPDRLRAAHRRRRLGRARRRPHHGHRLPRPRGLRPAPLQHLGRLQARAHRAQRLDRGGGLGAEGRQGGRELGRRRRGRRRDRRAAECGRHGQPRARGLAPPRAEARGAPARAGRPGGAS